MKVMLKPCAVNAFISMMDRYPYKSAYPDVVEKYFNYLLGGGTFEVTPFEDDTNDGYRVIEKLSVGRMFISKEYSCVIDSLTEEQIEKIRQCIITEVRKLKCQE